jgi:tripartite-type tricarboxylate transporter receptor subunit TctC
MKIFAAGALALAAATGTAGAQEFPTKPVTIIIPYSGGGSTDLMARSLATELQEMWGQPVIVENRAGAGSMIGTAYLSQQQPDGYTLLVNTAAHSTAPAVQKDLPFDPKTDITPIGMVATSPYVAVSGKSVKAEGFDEFVKEAKERPMFFATAGVGSSSHFAAELLIQQAGLPADVVHYSGGGEAQVNLMGGHADVYISTTASVMPYVNNGQVKALVVLAPERFDLLPDVQSSGENGVDGIEIDGWLGLIARDGFKKVLADNFVVAGDTTAAEFKQQVEKEMDLWVGLAKERNVVAQ